MKVLVIIIYLIFSTLGLIFMKSGGNTGVISIVNKDITLAINATSLIGLICYLISFFLYTKIVVLFDLSYIVPICAGLVQVLILIAAKIIFKEQISLFGIIGTILIIAGIIVMNLPIRK